MFTSLSLIAVSSLFPLVRGVQTFQVDVGPNGTLTYVPPFITPMTGDIVSFIFHPKNHTLTQTSFDNPCTPSGGFDSSFQPVAATADDGSVMVSYTVPSTNPLWFSCQQTNHCQQGMVFALNPDNSNPATSFETFQGKAKALATPSSTDSPAPSDTPPAASSSASPPATTTASAPPTGVTISIEVGPGSQLVYSPNNVTANAGDVIEFTFNPKNHTVTQSSFAAPCSPLAGGIHSGFIPVSNTTAEADLPQFNFTVQDATKPIWIYCGQTNHCSSGMVFAVNAPTTGNNTFAAFLAAAKAVPPTPTANASAAGASPTTSAAASGAMSGARVQYGLGLILGVVGLCVALF